MQRENILIADDDRLILATLEEGLRSSGYSVVSAASGREAVELCLRDLPDLAILDIKMPDMTGIEVANIISTDSTVPFMFLSAYNEAEIVNLAAKAGALGYMIKPIDVRRMLPAIETALSRASEIETLRLVERKLSDSLAKCRDMNTAVGLIMERFRLNKKDSFDMLRNNARSQRRKIADVAAEIVNAAELINFRSPKS